MSDPSKLGASSTTSTTDGNRTEDPYDGPCEVCSAPGNVSILPGGAPARLCAEHLKQCEEFCAGVAGTFTSIVGGQHGLVASQLPGGVAERWLRKHSQVLGTGGKR